MQECDQSGYEAYLRGALNLGTFKKFRDCSECDDREGLSEERESFGLIFANAWLEGQLS